MDTAQAVALARSNNQRGFEALYNATFTSKYYLALKYMGNAAAAQDVLQEAYLKAFTNLQMLKDPSKFSAWLGVIVANTAKNALQRQAPASFSDTAPATIDDDDFSFEDQVEDSAPGPETSLTDQERSNIVHELIDSLPAEQRMCVLMFYMENASLAEIAQALDCSLNTVKTRLRRGRLTIQDKAEDLRKRGLLVTLPFGLLLRYMRLDEAWMARGPQMAQGISLVGNKTFGQLRSIQAGQQATAAQSAQATQAAHRGSHFASNTAQTQTSRAATGAAHAAHAARTGFLTRKVAAAILGVAIGTAAAGGGYVAWSATQPQTHEAPAAQTQQAPQAPTPQQQTPQQQQQVQQQTPQQPAPEPQKPADPPKPKEPTQEEQKAQAIADAKAKGLIPLTGKIVEDYGDNYLTGAGDDDMYRGVKYAVFVLDTPQDLVSAAVVGTEDWTACKKIQLAQTTNKYGEGVSDAAFNKILNSGMTVLGYPKDGMGYSVGDGDYSPIDGPIADYNGSNIVQVWPKP